MTAALHHAASGPGPARQLMLIAHNIRSCHNAGSLIRTAEGLGVYRMVMSGYTPYPARPAHLEDRLPHVAARTDRQIAKTALGAENWLHWDHADNIFRFLAQLKADGWLVAAVEQAVDSLALPDFIPAPRTALIVGREVEGIEREVLAASDTVLQIPMFGHKESFNVVQAAAMALYHCRFA